MLAWCGFALAIKLQPAFTAPIIIALLIGRRVPIRLWPVAPAAFVAAMLPAWLLGWPAADLATIYLHQADWSPLLSLNAPNIWAIAQALPMIGDLPLTGLAIAAAVGVSAGLIARFAWQPPDRDQLLAAALLVTLATVGLLPRMHERYFFLADVLALGLAFARNDRRSWTIAGLVQLASFAGLAAYVSGLSGLAVIGALPMIAATWMVARPFLVSPANDNGLPLNPFRAYPA
jgi:Gpi18-like mannosyltransferase